MADFRRVRVLVGISALLLVLVISLGCARLNSNTTSSESAPTTEDVEPTPLYHNFEDVLVPSELKVDTKRTFVHHAPDFRAGVLVLTGRVEISSLVGFFEDNMAQDNWRTMMIFQKPNRDCIINITEKQFKTEVEIWVAPTTRTQRETLLK
jgi:hypothetical protein